MTGIKHHTLAGGRGIKIAKSSYNEEHDAGTIADVLTDHDLAAHTALGLAVEGSANATTLDGLDSTAFVKVADHTQAAHNSLNIDADTLDSIDSTGFVQTGDHTKAAHDALNIDADTLDDKHKTAFASAAHTHEGLLKQNFNLLWDKNDGDIPEGFIETSRLQETDFIIIKYIGGEEIMNLTHNVYFDIEANVTATITDFGGTTQLTTAGATTASKPFVNPMDKAFAITLTKSTAGDVTYSITATDTETSNSFVELPTVTVPGESNISVTFLLHDSAYIAITQT